MDHTDHVRLLGGIPQPGQIWADFGSGGGAFTLALAECLRGSGEIYSVDRDGGALQRQRLAMHSRFPSLTVHYLTADFTQALQLPALDGALDGVIMANSLHFLARKEAVLSLVRRYLHAQGCLIVVEYNVDRGNLWVPHPFSYPSWHQLAEKNGFQHTRLLATQPSRFLGEMYAALSRKSAG